MVSQYLLANTESLETITVKSEHCSSAIRIQFENT